MRRTQPAGPSAAFLCATIACVTGSGRCIAAGDIPPGTPGSTAAPDIATLEQRLEEHEKRLRQLSDAVALEQQQVEADRRSLESLRQSSREELAQAVGKGAAPGDQPSPAPVG